MENLLYSGSLVQTSFNKENKAISKIQMGELGATSGDLNGIPKTIHKSNFNCLKEAFNAKHKQVRGARVTLSDTPKRSEFLKGFIIPKNLHSR